MQKNRIKTNVSPFLEPTKRLVLSEIWLGGGLVSHRCQIHATRAMCQEVVKFNHGGYSRPGRPRGRFIAIGINLINQKQVYVSPENLPYS